MKGTFSIILCVIGIFVGLMYVAASYRTNDPKDFVAAVAWFGSSAFWLMVAVFSQ